MAKRVANRKVLEWVSEQVNLSAGSDVERAVISLNLDDDEIAEIHKIESEIEFTLPDTLVDGTFVGELMLSMDPSASNAASPYSEVQYEDLETVYNHKYILDVHEATAVGQTVTVQNSCKEMSFDTYPVLLATNPSFLTQETGVATEYNIRIWFTRRKAVGNELARTLLKRR